MRCLASLLLLGALATTAHPHDLGQEKSTGAIVLAQNPTIQADVEDIEKSEKVLSMGAASSDSELKSVEKKSSQIEMQEPLPEVESNDAKSSVTGMIMGQSSATDPQPSDSGSEMQSPKEFVSRNNDDSSKGVDNEPAYGVDVRNNDDSSKGADNELADGIDARNNDDSSKDADKEPAEGIDARNDPALVGVAVETSHVDAQSPDGRESEHKTEDRKKLFFWAQRSTTTKFKLSVFTSTTLYTCAVVRNNANDCRGRRRRYFRPVQLANMERDLTNLDTSLNGEPLSRDNDEDSRDPRSFLTVWSTSFSTKTVTHYATDTRATVSVSAACTVATAPFPTCGARK